jgi:nitrous oxidase accessory protein NosD
LRRYVWILAISLLVVANIPIKVSTTENTYIMINSDGTISPPTAPMTRNGDVYTLTKDINYTIFVYKNDTILDGSQHVIQGSQPGGTDWISGVGIFLCASGVTVRNFEIRDNSVGVWICNGYFFDNHTYSNNTISDNRFMNNYESIALVNDAPHTTVSNNIINNSVTGIMIESKGFLYQGGPCGLEMHYLTLGGTYSTTIANNSISYNTNGIIIDAFDQSSNDNWLYNNTISHNCFGLKYTGSPETNCSDNHVRNNNFIDNEVQVLIDYIITDQFDIAHNLWSDYRGLDVNNDGIGDTSYVIDTKNQDNYPTIPEFTSMSLMLIPLLVTVVLRKKQQQK